MDAGSRPARHPFDVPTGLHASCLRGLYSVVAVRFHARPDATRTGAVAWPGESAVTSSDAVRARRRWLGAEAMSPQAGEDTRLDKLPANVRERRLATPAPAA